MEVAKGVLVGVLVATVCALSAFSQMARAEVFPLGSTVTLPQGEELSDEQLLGVDGEVDPLTILATGIVFGAAGSVSYISAQLYQGNEVDPWEAALYFGIGFTTGIGKMSVPLVRAALASALRWSARAGSAATAVAHSAGQRAAAFLGVAQTALHNYVRCPLEDAVRGAWDWLSRR